MLRVPAIAMVIALALPTLALAQHEERHEGRQGVPQRGPVVRAPGPVIHNAPVVVRPGPGRGREFVGPVGGHQFAYHGHNFERIHLAPFVYPAGFGYRRWVVGGILPPLFLAPAYYYTDWATLGLAPPQPGTQWVRYGPDLLLVDVTTGAVVDAVYGAFY
jgi:Ni/Co efflux regulator RcnB